MKVVNITIEFEDDEEFDKFTMKERVYSFLKASMKDKDLRFDVDDEEYDWDEEKEDKKKTKKDKKRR